MSILRLVIAWLVMTVLPLQGFAAASMLFCGQAAHSTSVQLHASHDHASHGHEGHGHHDHAGANLTQQHLPEVSQAADGTVDDGHSCPICASCCNLVALSDAPTSGLSGDSPRSEPSQDASRVLTRDASTPDKPPRA
ncbi:hypothetical protein [Ramlibacter tataouinensis]|uniref:hypothetical protein n=1 Tax=Ramlibacter tataouinensis TaxID=94132 RepID=UPI0005A249DB|nr:hypothetical protein [Ramlibacter tataouinensis]